MDNMNNVDDYSSDDTSLIPSSFEVEEEHYWVEEEETEVENDLGLEEMERRPLSPFSLSLLDPSPAPPPPKAWWTEEYEPVEGMPGYIYLTRPILPKKDDLKETLSEKKEDVPMTTTEEPMPDIVEPVVEPEPEPEPEPVVVAESIQKTNSWSSGRIYKALNITDPADAAAAAAEAAEAAAARAKAEEAAARAARAKTDTTSGRRPQGASNREPRRNNEPSNHPRGSRVSVLRPTSGTIPPSIPVSHPDPRQSGQKQRPDRDRGQQGPRDQEIQARTDLLCRFPASRHSSRDREPCTRSHSLADWSPRTCHHHPCSRPACTFYHPTTENKKEYLEKILQNKASFYATHSRDFHKLYLQ
jgi:hypothetical protein